MHGRRIAALSLLLAAALTGCATPRWVYRYEPGRTAIVENGTAIAPPGAPAEVHAAIAAGNRIAGSPYARGGGHGGDTGCYDCSGATSCLLREAGLMRGAMPSTGFRSYGSSGEGEWISIYARKGHVFLTVAGLRYDTGWHGETEGPRWTTKSRPIPGYRVRHPGGL